MFAFFGQCELTRFVLFLMFLTDLEPMGTLCPPASCLLARPDPGPMSGLDALLVSVVASLLLDLVPSANLGGGQMRRGFSATAAA